MAKLHSDISTFTDDDFLPPISLESFKPEPIRYEYKFTRSTPWESGDYNTGTEEHFNSMTSSGWEPVSHTINYDVRRGATFIWRRKYGS